MVIYHTTYLLLNYFKLDIYNILFNWIDRIEIIKINSGTGGFYKL